MKQGSRETHYDQNIGNTPITPMLSGPVRQSAGGPSGYEYADLDHPSTVRKDYATAISKFHPAYVEAERSKINSFSMPSSNTARAAQS